MIASSPATARRRRAEGTYASAVRDEVFDRDERCRAACKGVGPCGGPDEWSHLWNKRRCFTRKMEPAERHDAAWTVRFCGAHHDLYDAHQFDVEPLDPEKGANGRLRFSGMGHVVEEP